MNVLVTGAAGFIGMHVALRLLQRGDNVVGIDNLNDYYDPQLKRDRLHLLKNHSSFIFASMDLADNGAIAALFAQHQFDLVVNLAAQAGVRYSVENPRAYIDSNVVGFLNILEGCRNHNIKHLVYASSSSVYGANERLPFSVNDSVDHPLSMYAATKKSNELMAHSYSSLFNLPTTALRFFTVYGPWGRPDMALFKFTKAIINNEEIPVFNFGNHRRDFTYIDDICEGIVRVLDNPAKPNASWDGAQPDPGSSKFPWRVYNIGNATPVMLMDYIKAIEKALGKSARMKMLPLQPGDVPDTHADVQDLISDTGFKPQTSVDEGIAKFVDWFVAYYNDTL